MWRLLRNHRGYLALLTLVLGASTGVNLLVFTVVNALWLRPMEFPDPDRVVILPRAGFPDLSGPPFQILEGGVAGQVTTGDESGVGVSPRLQVPGESELEVLGITPDYFKVLQLTIRGRSFSREDEWEGAEPVAIISDRFWSRVYSRRRDVIGSILQSKPLPVRLVGIAPPGFRGVRRGEEVDVWIPVAVVRRVTSRSEPTLLPLGRVGHRQTLEEVNERFEALAPGMLRLLQTRWTSVTDVFGTQASPTTVIREGQSLLVASALALLVLCGGWATVAALVILHYERRRGELALKAALGASRWRLVSDLCRELASLAAIGSVAGLFVAALGVRIVPALSLPGGISLQLLDLSFDWRVVIAGIAITFVTLFAAAIWPLKRATRIRIGSELLTGPSTVSRRSLRARQFLLSLQVCTTVVILVCAGLLVRTVNHGFGTAPGFEVDRTAFLTISEPLPLDSKVSPEVLAAERNRRLSAVIRQVPGVVDVASGSSVAPLGAEAVRNSRTWSFQVGGRQLDVVVGALRGSPNLLSTLGVPILVGRPLIAADALSQPRPVIVTRSLASLLFPEGDVLDQVFSVQERGWGLSQVVGVSADLTFGSLTSPASGVIVSVWPGTAAMTRFVVRAEYPDSVASSAGRLIKSDSLRTITAREMIAADIGRQRLGAWFFSGFGIVALLLGVGGAFGLVAYVAESRRREFGIRMALGADRAVLVRIGVGAALMPVSAGVAAGIPLGGASARMFSGHLVGIGSLDPLTYCVVAGLMLGSAASAGLMAAWRLRKTTPTDALRAG